MAQNLDSFTYQLEDDSMLIDSENGFKSLSVLCPIRSSGNITILGQRTASVGGVLVSSNAITLVPGDSITISGYNLDIGGITIDATGSGTIAVISAT
jgi:hypothetical protein